MKFPKKLSPERLSLLTLEDRKIYEDEWRNAPQTSILDGPATFDSDKIDDKKIIREELKTVYDEFVYDTVDKQEYQKFISENRDIFYFNENAQLAVNEGVAGEGYDALYWTKNLKLGWLGGLLAAGLTGLATGIAALITAGKDTLAMWKLKRYMNRIVEIIDQGILKKRSFFSFLMPKKKSQFMGERNLACLRSIQEMADRNMTVSVMSAAHKLGFFGEGDMMNIPSGGTPQSGGGLDAFRKNVLSKFNIVLSEKPAKNVNAIYDEDKAKLDTF